MRGEVAPGWRLDNRTSSDGMETAVAAGGCARLLCASQWTGEGSAVQALLAQRRGWLRRSAENGVRTALLSVAGWVVHWHEGPAGAVEAEWLRHRAQATARAVRLLHRSTGAGALHAEVQIASLHGAEGAADVARRLRALERAGGEVDGRDPIGIWQALAAPCQLGPLGGAELSRRDFLAVASEDHEAVDLVRLVAQHRGLRVAYQRHADTDLARADAGASYLDVPQDEGGIARVHALPRRALLASRPLLGLREVGVLVLLLGRNGARARLLLDDTRQWLQALARPPAVLVACPFPDVREFALHALSGVAGTEAFAVDGADRAQEHSGLLAELIAFRDGGAFTMAFVPSGTGWSPSLPGAPAG